MNMIMIYKDIMTPIEMLSHFDRLPVKISSIYEPNLLSSMIAYSNNTPEYETLLNFQIDSIYDQSELIEDVPASGRIQLSDLASDPIPACQFHVIERKCNSMDELPSQEIYTSASHLYTNPYIFKSNVAPFEINDTIIITDHVYEGRYFLKYFDFCRDHLNTRTQEITSMNPGPKLRVNDQYNVDIKREQMSQVDFIHIRNSTLDSTKIENLKILSPIVSVYPDHGESVYLDTEIHSFRVSAREYGFDEIKEEIDLDFYDEILAFSLN